MPGTQFLRKDGTRIPDAFLTTPDGKPGLKADYNGGIARGPRQAANTTPLVSRTEANVNLTGANLPAEIVGRKRFGMQWWGNLTPTESGDYLLGIRCQEFGTLTVDGKQIAVAFGGAADLQRASAASSSRKVARPRSTSATALTTGTRMRN